MTDKPYQYRIVEHPNGFEPQMLYNSRGGPMEVWFSLNPTGHWLEPDAYNVGVITCHCLFEQREQAERVITCAKAINEEHIREVQERPPMKVAKPSAVASAALSHPSPPDGGKQ